MGAWDELDREFILDSSTDDLDELIDELDSGDFGDIFEPALKQAEAYKEAFEDGCEQGMEVIANNLVAKEQKEIGDTGKHPYSQGILETSILAEGDVNSYIVGTTINHIYPMSVEYGADIYPKTPDGVLKMYPPKNWDGKIGKDGFVYLKEAHPKAHPFVEPAWEDLTSKIERSGFGVFRSVCDKMNQVKT